VLSPFPGSTLSAGETGFVFSTSKTHTGSLHLLQDRLIDIGRTSNGFNFLAKTRVNKRGQVSKSKGIGGMSKLKDFSFTILKSTFGQNAMSTSDILSLYGRTVILYISPTENSLDISSSYIEFKGQVYSVKREDSKLTFNVRGMLASASPIVVGNTVKKADGTTDTETLIFGDSDTYIQVFKKRNAKGKKILQFSQGDDYLITGLYVKIGKNDDDVEYLPITTPYEISNNEIIFKDPTFSGVYLGEDLTKTSSSSIQRIKVSNNHYEVGIVFTSSNPEGDITPYISVGSSYAFFYKGATTSTHNILTYIRKEVVGGKTVYFFKVGAEFVYGSIRTLVDSGAKDGQLLLESNYLVDIDFIIDSRKAPIEKEVDAYAYEESSLEYEEVKDKVNVWSYKGGKCFQAIPKEPLVIQLGDEKMLVVYTEMDYCDPYEMTASRPSTNYIWVFRGYDETPLQSHNSGDRIIVLGSDEEKIDYVLERKLQGLKTLTPSYDIDFSNVNSFLSGDSNLNISSLAGKGFKTDEHDACGYIGLDWKLPELSGDLSGSLILGEAYCHFSEGVTNTSYTETVSINLALDSISQDGTHPAYFRRSFGDNVSHYDTEGNSTYKDISVKERDDTTGDILHNVNGEYVLKLDRANHWFRPGGAGENNPVWSWGVLNPSLEIVDYNELKDVSMYFVFNTSSIKNKQSVFSITLPKIQVNMRTLLTDVDVYAKVINKSILTNYVDSFSIGSNCKIAWATKDKYELVFSDEGSKCFGKVGLNPLGKFFEEEDTLNPPSNKEGFLSSNVVVAGDRGKIYHTEKEGYKKGYPSNFSRLDLGNKTFFDEGKILIENGSYYVYVDQANNRLLSIIKSNNDIDNPVGIIETLVDNYYTGVIKDTAVFSASKEKRKDWAARLIVSGSKDLTFLVDLISKNHGLITYEGNNGNLSVITLDPPVEDDVDVDIGNHIKVKDSKIDVKEKFTEIDYLISSMDVYYNKIGQSYKGITKSSELSQESFDKAKEYLQSEVKNDLNLDTVFEPATANRCADIKMIYHQVPTRILILKCTLALQDYHPGMWVTCSSSKIQDVSGKIYLITNKITQVPFLDKNPYVELTLFEFDWDSLNLRIQEVPYQTVVDNYDEVISDINTIEEVPNA
jgi:hypothetical protein